MPAHMKVQHNYINVRVGMPGGKEIFYHIPNSEIQNLNSFLNKLDISKNEVAPWDETISWELLAKDRIEKYKKAGLVLRGARYREGLSQKKLAEITGISQENISKMENGKRTVGEKVAKTLAKALHLDYRLFLD